MRRSGLDLDSLPETIAIFPLRGALLLPGGRLPLNIFEPRYLAMVSDSLSSPHRLIGMIQPQPRGSDSPEDNPALYPIGCVGRIAQFEETTDGRYLITLEGVIRFVVKKELALVKGYRRVRVCYGQFAHDLDFAPPEFNSEFDKDRLMAALKTYFDQNGFTADWATLENCETEKLITTLSMICPLDDADKQALLESITTSARADTLSTLLEMAIVNPSSDLHSSSNVKH